MAKSIPVGSGLSKGSVSNNATLTTGLSSPDFHLPFFHYLSIPENTSQFEYVSYTLLLPIGRINKIWVEFPLGCAGLAAVQLWRGVQQIFPLPSGNWLRSHNSVLNFAFTHEINTEPYEVEIRGYNLDDTYNHTIWIGLEMSGLPSEITPQLRSFLDTLKA